MAIAVQEPRLAPSQVARELGVSTSLVRLWFKTGVLPCEVTPLGRLVPESAVRELARERAERRKAGEI